MSIPTENQVTEWLLDADQHIGELQKVYRGYKQQERQEKQVEYVRKQLDKQTAELGKSTNALSGATGKYSAAVQKIIQESAKYKYLQEQIDKKEQDRKRTTEQFIAISEKNWEITHRQNSGLQEYEAGLSKLGSASTVVGSGMVRTWTDVVSVFQTIKGIFGAAASTIGGVLTQGVASDAMWKSNTLSIGKAHDSVKGFISDSELLKASNKATVFELGLSEQQFANLAKGAVVASKKIGGDVPKAIDDLMTGMARMSKPILDNLGIQLSVNKAQDEYAKQIGKTSAQLSDAEKKQAFVNAAIADLQRIAGDTTLEVSDLGTAYANLQTGMDNAEMAFSRFVASMISGKSSAQGASDWLNEIASNLNKMSDPSTRKKLAISDQISELTPKMTELGNQIDFVNREWRSGQKPFFGADEKLAQALSFRNKYIALQREFTNIRVSEEKASSDKEYKEWLAGQQKQAEAQIAAFEAQKANAIKAAKKSKVDIEKYFAEGIKIDWTPVFKTQPSWAPPPPIVPDTSELDSAIKESMGLVKEARAILSPEAAPTSRWTNEAALIADANYQLQQYANIQQQINDLALGDLGEDRHRELVKELQAQGKAAKQAASNLSGYRSVIQSAESDVAGMAEGALSSFTSGLWAAAAAAIQGSEDMGTAVAKMVSDVLLGVAAQATVKAIFEAAEAIAAAASFNYAGAAAHGAAAAMYAAVAVLAGAGGLAVASAVPSTSSSSSSSSATTSATTATPNYGEKIEDNRPINISVYLGDVGDPALSLLMSRQIKAQMRS